MIRTLAQLRIGTTADGRQVLKGTLTRDVVTRDEHGRERTYPRGTGLVLRKDANGRTYRLLAILDENAAPAAEDNATAVHLTKETPQAADASTAPLRAENRETLLRNSPPRGVDPTRARLANAHDAAHMGHDFIPF